MKPTDDNDAIAAWMHRLAEDANDPFLRPLQNPDLLWMKAQISERQAAAQRILRPAVICDRISRGMIGFAACWLALAAAKTFAPAFGTSNPLMYSTLLALALTAATAVVHPIIAGE